MVDNVRDSHPNLYQRIPSWFHVMTARCIGNEKCGYCNEMFDGAELTHLTVKGRDIWVCQSCRQEFKHISTESINK